MPMKGDANESPYRRWCVSVALQSFCGEPWALSRGQGGCDHSDTGGEPEHTDAASRQQKLDAMTHIAGAPLQLCENCAKQHVNDTEREEHLLHLLDVLRQYNSNEKLLEHTTDVLFALESPTLTGTSEHVENALKEECGAQMHYELLTPLDPLVTTVLSPAVSVVTDECLNAMVLVYGATQEMRQFGVIGTPEKCGLLPQGIFMVMNRTVELQERELNAMSHPLAPSAVSEAVEGNNITTSTNDDFGVIGTHSFVRAESTFIAFGATCIVDLLDLRNDHVELVLHLEGSPSAPHHDEGIKTSPGLSGDMPADAHVCHARTMPAEHANHALEALDIGLGNFTRATEMGLLHSDAGSSLLFSLTLFTDDCRSATFHFLCLAEDATVQNWLASSTLAHSQAIPDGEKPEWPTRQNMTFPEVPDHNTVTMLVPSLSFGNLLTSVLVCGYNSIIALQRLSRDLNFAVTGCRVMTMPQFTDVKGQRSYQPLPPEWEEGVTQDGRRYYVEKSTKRSTWDDPRIELKERRKKTPLDCSDDPQEEIGFAIPAMRQPLHIPLNKEDKAFLDEDLRNACRGTLPSTKSKSEEPPYRIVVVDTGNEQHVLLGSTPLRQTDATQIPSIITCTGVETHVMGEISSRADAAPKTLCGGELEAGVKDDGSIFPADSDEEEEEDNSKKVMGVDEADRTGHVVYEVENLQFEIPNKPCVEKEDMTEEAAEGGESVTAPESQAKVKNICTRLVRGAEGNASVGTPRSNKDDAPLSTSEATTTCVRITPEMQELESLVEEFFHFYVAACETKKRVEHLEQEMARIQKELENKKEMEDELRRERDQVKLLREQLAAVHATQGGALKPLEQSETSLIEV
ncbi:hypothetical protein TraAM80_00121 [Trypanosoma rangeli]|uniref:WW domain-containing protein n=1 Tax=Trypanosoma rangeli TaxID=5698 RepID=A0A3R7MCD8_TRYRA|nr:uncharacterized protein TraAM80_00121 [Trypanosoma rangeli]RNF12766.1 hypothetical protein TraAM80_00121 [Trypanosoma rangeli]|eukprot:RNF12766.1 hypothetical protein TraAM80_00121 [Trypanosoma rangeli]